MVPGAATVGSVAPASERKPSMHALALDRPSASDRAGEHELDERLVERLALVLGVVGGEQLGGRRAQLDGHERVALGLDPAQDLARRGRGVRRRA